MNRSGLILAALLATGAPAAAQSGNTAAGGAAAGPSDMETCLLDRANCTSDEYRSPGSITLDDAVELGIIDREAAEAGKAAGSASARSAEPLPSIDMEIQFDFDSDKLREDQFVKLVRLSNLLREKRFSGYRFAFLGHTDAKGSRAYNRDLSLRRAQSVSDFVSQAGSIPGERMIASGMGSTRLKAPDDPFAAVNRRVQLVLIPAQ